MTPRQFLEIELIQTYSNFIKNAWKSKHKACISLKIVYNEKVCVKRIFVGGKNL